MKQVEDEDIRPYQGQVPGKDRSALKCYSVIRVAI